MTEIDLLKRKIERQIAARKQAESILEHKALELFEANKSLNELNATLESQIEERTKDFEEAKILAENAQRAEANFLASMSHEIRTPLNAIIGMSHLLKDAQLNSDEEGYLKVLGSSAKILHRLITDILDISKIDSGELEIVSKPFELKELVNTIVKSFQVKIKEKEIDLNVKVDSKLNSHLMGDELLVNQVMLNLISNAVKFTEKGFININIRVLSYKSRKYKIGIEVEDSGIGMKPDELDKIFERFKQASFEIRHKYGGTGLGLAVTKKIVNTLNGSISVESAVGKGSKFMVELDFEESDTEPIPTATKKINSKSSIQLKHPILIVEDNEMNQMYISKLCEKWNLEYELAKDGKEGSDMAIVNKYALIFMDLQMPIMSGFESTKRIRQESKVNKEIPIIALTASTLLSKKERALSIGMDSFLAKPFQPQQLLDTILEHTEQAEISKLKNEEELTSFAFNDILDVQFLEANFGEDLEYYSDMMQIFLDIIPKELELLENAISKEEFTEAGRIAHKIKPSYSMMGLSKLSEALNQIETDSKSNGAVIVVFQKYKSQLENALKIVSIENDKVQKTLIK